MRIAMAKVEMIATTAVGLERIESLYNVTVVVIAVSLLLS